MGIDPDYAMAFAKSQAAAGNQLPTSGSIFISISDSDKPDFIPIARKFAGMGFKMIATPGTAQYLRKHEIECVEIQKISVGRPNIADLVANNEISMIVNTFTGFQARADEKQIRTLAVHAELPLITTINAARAASEAIEALRTRPMNVKPLQDYHKELGR
jgi:carbamoyl-phosphate synthase large subunit